MRPVHPAQAEQNAPDRAVEPQFCELSERRSELLRRLRKPALAEECVAPTLQDEGFRLTVATRPRQW